MTHVTKNVKTFPVMCLTSLRDERTGTAHSVNNYTLLDFFCFFVYLDFLSQTFTIHTTAGEEGGYILTPLYHFHPLHG